MTAILLQSVTSVITKCDRYYKVRQFYYKVRQVLQSATEQTLQREVATKFAGVPWRSLGISHLCDNFSSVGRAFAIVCAMFRLGLHLWS